MGSQALSKQVGIDDFVSQLRKFPESAFDRTDKIFEFLTNTPVTADTLAPYLTWDRQHYTRNLIDKTPLYELLAICWEVGQVSSVTTTATKIAGWRCRLAGCWLRTITSYRRIWTRAFVGSKQQKQSR